MLKLVSGKVKVLSPSQVANSRYEFLDLQSAEPNLGVAPVEGYILAYNSSLPGGRQWIDPATGNMGPQGVQGAPGAQGNPGAQGVQGSIGAQGVQGASGAQGTIGAQGVQGASGAQGAVLEQTSYYIT